jgi:hypothetical protein
VLDVATRSGWGPDRRPAAVAITVDVADHPPPPPGVLAALLDHLDRRAVTGTWFVAVNTDPVLVDRLYFARHEIAALAPWTDVGLPLGPLRAHDIDMVVGARLVGGDGMRAADASRRLEVAFVEAAELGLTYVSIDPDVMVPGASVAEAVRSIPVLVAPGVGWLAEDPHGWLRAVQVDVGRAIELGRAAEVRIDPAVLDRPPAFGVVAEAVDLVAGLARAGRVHVDRLRDLVAEGPADGHT